MKARARILWLLLYAALAAIEFLATKAKEYAEGKVLGKGEESAPVPDPPEGERASRRGGTR